MNGRQCIRLHVKTLVHPRNFRPSIRSMLDAMHQLYDSVGLGLEEVSAESLELPSLRDVDIGRCVRGNVTSEQRQLFSNRNDVGANEIVVYFVRTTNPPTNGCAAHPAGRPGAVVTTSATLCTLAHEVGHVLDLNHVDSNFRLMTDNGTRNIRNPPPDFVASEMSRMKASSLTRPCTS